MLNVRTLSLILLSGVGLAMIAGSGTLLLSKSQTRWARPVQILVLAMLLVCFVVAWISCSDAGLISSNWSVGWVVSAPQIAKVRVGVLLDPAGLFCGSLFILLSFLSLLALEPSVKPQREERTAASLCFAVGGVCLSWLSVSPWLVFIGMFFSVLGGFVSLADSEGSFSQAPRFLLERALGFLLCLSGALMLTGSGVEASWVSPQAWHPGGMVQTAGILFCFGIVLQFGGFPLSSSSLLQDTQSVCERFLATVLAPGFSALVFLFRFRKQLVEADLLQFVGWFLIAAAVLSTLTGLFQNSWRKSFATLGSAVFCLVGASLVFASPLVSMALLTSACLSALCLTIGGQVAMEGAEEEITRKRKLKIDSVAAIPLAAAFVLSGGFGFLGSWSFLYWIRHSLESALAISLIPFTLFLFMLLVWRVGWMLVAAKTATRVSWRAWVSAGLCLLSGLAIFWVGEATGLGLVSTQISGEHPFLARFVEASLNGVNIGDELGEPGIAVWLYAGIFLTSGVVAFFLHGVWSKVFRAIPKSSQFISNGYGISVASAAITSRVREGAALIEQVATRLFWEELLSDLGARALVATSRAFYVADVWVGEKAGKAFEKTLDVSVRVPRLIQSGDAQWYLFFGILCTILILVNFLMN